MATTSVTLSGFVYDNSGNAVQDAGVTAYTSADNATSAISGLTDTTDANGRWDITTTNEAQYPMDIKITFGSSVRWIKAGNGINLTRLTVSGNAVFGEDATGVDVTMYGDTTGRYLLWDQSEDALQLNDNTELKIGSLAAGDMILYHDGTNSYITNATGALKIATESSGIAVTIGHGTSEVTVADNLTVTGDLTVSGTTTSVSTTNTIVKDSLIEINNGASSNSNDLGVVMERGSTGDNAIIAWDESADVFTVGTTTATGASTGNLTITAAGFTAAAIVGTTIDASTDFTIGDTVVTDGVVTDSSGLQLAANLDINGTVDISSTLTLGTVAAAGSDTDKFLVLDGSGNVDYRTGTQVLSDIGGTGATALDDIGTGDAATTLATTTGNITIDAQATDADVVIKVDDDGSAVTAVTFDGSDEGNAIFVNDIQLNSDGALLEFGADQDTVLTHTDGTGLTLNSTNKLTFGDAASFVQQSSDGTLRIDGESIIDLNASTRVDVSGALTAGGIIKTDDTTAATTIADGSLQTDGGLSVTFDAVIGDDLILISDSAVLSLGIGADVTLTHDGTTGGTLAATPLTLTSATAATWSTSAGALTLNGTGGLVLQEGGAAIIGISDARVIATTNTASVDLDASGAIQINSSGGALSIGNDNIDQTINVGSAGTRTINVGIDDGTDLSTVVIKGSTFVGLDATPADESVSGLTARFTAGEALERGEVVYYKASDSEMYKAVASATGTKRCVAMAAEDIANGNVGHFLLQGFITDNSTFPNYVAGDPLIAGNPVYTPEAETSNQNVPEATAPADDGDFVQVIGYIVAANTLYFNPSNDIIEHA